MKTFVIGSVGSGKTTFSKHLSRISDRQHFEVDEIIRTYDESGRRKKTDHELDLMYKQMTSMKTWIIEGTYRVSCDYLLELADEIIFLDIKSWIRFYRIHKRFIKQQLKIEQSHYKSNLKMLRMMWKWHNDFDRDYNKFITMLNQYDCVIILNRTKDITNYLKDKR